MISKKVIKLEGPQPRTNSRCIGCGGHVNPGMCYTGSVIAGTSFLHREGVKTLPVLGTIETYDRTYVIGGQQVPWNKSIPYVRRNKGFLCDDCASQEYKTVEIRGVKHQIVKTDPRPGFIGSSIIPKHEYIPSQTSTEHEEPVKVVQAPHSPINHWLDVGRRK